MPETHRVMPKVGLSHLAVLITFAVITKLLYHDLYESAVLFAAAASIMIFLLFSRKIRKTVRVTLSISAILLIFLPASLLAYLDYEYSSHGRFDRGAWLAAGPYENCVRYQMAKDIVENRVREGMTRRQVVALLGGPRGNTSRCTSYDFLSCHSAIPGFGDIKVCYKSLEGGGDAPADDIVSSVSLHVYDF